MLSESSPHYLLDGWVLHSSPPKQWRTPAFSALVCVGVCLTISFAAAASSGLDQSGAALARTSVQLWLVSVGAGLTVNGTSFTLVPIGATLMTFAVGWLVARGFTAKSQIEPVGFGAKVGAMTGISAGLLSAVTSVGQTSTSFARATFGAFLVIGLAAAFGAAASTKTRWLGAPTRLVSVLTGASVSTTLVLLGSAALTFALLASNLNQAANIWASLGPDSPILLALMCVLSMFTMTLWATATIFGPGFYFGPEATVDLTGNDLGLLPGFPPLAAIAEPGPYPSLTAGLLLLPLIAAVLGGLATYRRLAQTTEPSWASAVAECAAGGAVAGFVIGLLTQTASGSIGPGLMGQVGPASWQTLLIAVPLMAIGAALAGTGAHYRSTRDKSAV